MAFSDLPIVNRMIRSPDFEGELLGIPCLEDNLAWALVDAGGDVLLFDVPEAGPVSRVLDKRGWRLDRVVITHGHHDHVGGIGPLRKEHPAEIWAHRRLGLDQSEPVPGDGKSFDWKGLEIRVLDTSGHSDCDTSFVLPSIGVCICGDTLFAGGCGRLFSGPPERMWESLLRLRALPDDTLLCPGHDYALDNYRFAARTFPGIPVFREWLDRVESAASAGEIFAPVRVGDQSRSNPMLMADHPEVAGALGMSGETPWEVFAEIRARRSRG
jgi:hydroxyacylglutathione hydrolase